MKAPALHGLVAEFEEPGALLAAARVARAANYRQMDAYAPYHVEGLAEELGMRFTGVPLTTLLCGIGGGATGYLMQLFAAAHDYELNVGGRPFHSWPAFIPITFELTVLAASFGAALSMLILNGLPRLNHPIFETPFFAERNSSRFYLCIEARDRHFDREKTWALLEMQHPAHIWEVFA
jgi:hypothetical protein